MRYRFPKNTQALGLVFAHLDGLSVEMLELVAVGAEYEITLSGEVSPEQAEHLNLTAV